MWILKIFSFPPVKRQSGEFNIRVALNIIKPRTQLVSVLCIETTETRVTECTIRWPAVNTYRNVILSF